jgi:hypothetical protein
MLVSCRTCICERSERLRVWCVRMPCCRCVCGHHYEVLRCWCHVGRVFVRGVRDRERERLNDTEAVQSPFRASSVPSPKENPSPPISP